MPKLIAKAMQYVLADTGGAVLTVDHGGYAELVRLPDQSFAGITIHRNNQLPIHLNGYRFNEEPIPPGFWSSPRFYGDTCRFRIYTPLTGKEAFFKRHELKKVCRHTKGCRLVRPFVFNSSCFIIASTPTVAQKMKFALKQLGFENCD